MNRSVYKIKLWRGGGGGRSASNCFERRPVCNRPDPLFFCRISLEREATFGYLDLSFAVLAHASTNARLDLYVLLRINRN